MSYDSVYILGVRVNNITTDETLEAINKMVADGGPHQIVTVNPEFVMQAQHNPAFRVVLGEATLALPDGAGLLWAAHLGGHPLHERVTGSDTLPLIAHMSAQRGYRIYLLGAAPGVAEKAAALLTAKNPGLEIAGTFAGSPDPSFDDEIVSRIVATSPDMLFVAYGAPRQDFWIHRNLERLQVPVCMGIGGALDFITGVTQRAPGWMRNAGLEWLHRLYKEPWRWRRMLALPLFVIRVLAKRFDIGRD